jgi:hypothetical protein
MTRDDIIRLTRDAGWNGIYSKPLITIGMQEEDFLRFAALVAEAEREQCAKVCDGTRYSGYSPPEDGAAPDYYNSAAEECAAAIRARGKP